MKGLREARDQTQADVFNDTGIHVARIETGARDPVATTIGHLCKHFGISEGEFYSDRF